MNRFERLTNLKKFLLLTFFVVAIIAILELMTYTITFLLYFTGFTKGSAYEKYKENLHPLFTGNPLRPSSTIKTNMRLHDWNEYDPWYGYRNSYKNKRGIYGTDVLGFISNGDHARDISFKSENVFRIFVLGGSTVAGHGTSSPEKTIPNQLEKYLNLQRPENLRYTFQVINAGVAGYYSAIELAYLEYEIIYYEPDMVIVFDGYNDFLKMIYEMGQKSRIERYHWSAYHKYLKNYVDNQTFKFQLPERLQLWRYLYCVDILYTTLIRHIQDMYSHREKEKELPNFIVRNYPTITKKNFWPIRKWRNGLDFNNWLTEKEIESLPGRVSDKLLSRYVNNIGFMKSICDQKRIYFLSILQPMLIPGFKDVLTPVEKMFYDCNAQYLAQEKHVNYHKIVYELSKGTSRQLSKLVGDSFVDLTRLFFDFGQDIYVDWAHYNDFGNQIIGKYLAAVVLAKTMKREDMDSIQTSTD